MKSCRNISLRFRIPVGDRRVHALAWYALATIFILASPLLAQVAAKKTLVPTDAAQAEAMKLAKEVYGDEYSKAKTVTEKRDLAKKLLGKARDTQDDPAGRFVLLKLAKDIATQASDAATAFQAIDETAATFQVDALEMKSGVLTKLAATAHAPAAHKSVSAEALKLVVQATTDDNFPVAKTLGVLVIEEARMSDDDDFLSTAQAAIASATDAAKAYEDVKAANVKLEKTPDDPEANLAVGKYLCLVKGDWDKGLPKLALGGDEELKALAKRELDGVASSTEQAKLGDGWWSLAEKQEGGAKKNIQARAGHWYGQALPGLSGLMKDKVEKRLAKVAAAPAIEAESGASGGRPPLAVAPFNETTAKQHQARWAKFLHVPVVETNSIGMKLVLIPPGEFQMGSPKKLIEEELRLHVGDRWYSDLLPGEGPQHRVRITKPYWLAATDVTQEEYQRVMGSNPSKFQGDPKRPVEQVSWDDAVEFCRRLSEVPGEKTAKRRYGLPTEAQWEHACRAGSAGRRCFSAQTNPVPLAVEEKRLREYAWFNGNAGGQTHPVEQKRANAWGLYDMHGDVWEWCQDWYDSGYYVNSPTDDPTGPPTGSNRVDRSGGWANGAGGCRSALRGFSGPGVRDPVLGFRVSQVPADK